MAQRFSSLVDVQKIQQLLDRLYEATGIPSGIIDIDSNILSATGWQDICTKFHRVCNQTRQNCIESDQMIAEHLQDGHPYFGYTCKNGLLEYACPIIIEGKHLATLVIGQFFTTPPDEAFFREQALRYGFNEAEYLKALRTVPIFSQSKLSFILNFFVTLADLLSCSGAHSLKHLKAANFLHQILDAIPSPIFYKNVQGQYIGCNKAFAEFNGKERDELIGRSVYEVFPSLAAKKYQAMDQELLQQKSVQVYEYRTTSANGQQRDVLFHKAPFRDIDGTLAGLVGVITDISERKQMEMALRQSEAKYRALFDHMLNGFVYFKAVKAETGQIINYRFVEINEAYSHLTGLSRQELLNRKLTETVLAEEVCGTDWITIFNSVLENRQARTFEFSSNLLQKHFLISLFTPDQEHVAALLCDITKRKQNEERTQYYAYHDPLTGLPNRRLFEDRLAMALAQFRRNGEGGAVLFLDLDNFKPVNDTYGHDAGDELLKKVACRMENSIRESDTVARLGGDEFVIILPGVNSAEEIEIIANRILAACREPIPIEQDEVVVTASIGISLYPKDGSDITSLMRKADMAMFVSKRNGRNRFAFIDQEAHACESW